MASVNNHESRINSLEQRKTIPNLGTIDALEGTSDLPNGLSINEVYDNGYPCMYGNVINLGGIGMGQLLVEWSGTSGAKGGLFFRSQRDVNDANWSEWSKVWTVGDVITNACWNDYAERFEKPIDLKTEPGDIISLDKSYEKEMYKLATEGDINIAGVHSDEYGMLIGGTEDEEYNKEHFIPVGMIGRVKTKVIGPIHKGDRIVPSNIAGVGRKFKDGDNIFSIIGYSTETNLDENIKKSKS